MSKSLLDSPLALHAHRLVLSSQRTLYVCPYDCDTPNLIDLDLRVSSLARFAPGASVVLVGIKSDDSSKSSSAQLEATLLSRYKRLKNVCLVLLHFSGTRG